MLGFTLWIAVLTGLIFGLVPALQIPATALHDALKDTSRGSTEGKGRSWTRDSLVVSEIAFACVLLVGAGLLMRSFLRVLDVNLGFQPERAAALRVDPSGRNLTLAQQNAYFDEVLRRAREIPGIEAAGLTDALPLGRNRSWGAAAKGHVYAKGEFPIAFVRMVSDGYVGAMGIPLIAGRDFSERDTPNTESVIVINETMARRLFPGQDAIGQMVGACNDNGRRVVGVVGDVRHLALEQGAGMEMYLPIRQCNDWSSVDLVVRTTLPPAELAGAVRAALKPVDPNLAANDFRTLQQLVDKAVSPRRFVVMLLGGFAVFALILASLGIYARDFVFGESAHAGNWHSHGAGCDGWRFASGHHQADAGSGGDGDAAGRGCFVGAGACAKRAAVRRDCDRPRHVCWNADRAYCGGGAGWLSACAPCFAHRSDDCAARKLAYFLARGGLIMMCAPTVPGDISHGAPSLALVDNPVDSGVAKGV